jgi:hypothetical protein
MQHAASLMAFFLSGDAAAAFFHHNGRLAFVAAPHHQHAARFATVLQNGRREASSFAMRSRECTARSTHYQ